MPKGEPRRVRCGQCVVSMMFFDAFCVCGLHCGTVARPFAEKSKQINR